MKELNLSDLEKDLKLVEAQAQLDGLHNPSYHRCVCAEPDFLHPQQQGPFRLNGLSYLEWRLIDLGCEDPENLAPDTVRPAWRVQERRWR